MTSPAAFTVLYDLRDAEAWRKAHRDRSLWGKFYTDIHPLDNDHIALVFRPAGPRRARWEEVRRQWIVQEVAA
jgi:hypothetical protein